MIDSIHTFQADSANANSTFQLKNDETNTEPIHRKRDEESKNIILGTLFYSTQDIKNSKPTIKERTTEKDRELAILENIFHRRLKKDYIEKLTELLKTKHDPKYVLKRKKINQMVYQLDENNNLYLTLPKIYSNQENEKANIRDYQHKATVQIYEHKKPELNSIVPEFFSKEEEDKQHLFDYNIYKDLDDSFIPTEITKEQKKLFEKLTTKKEFYEHKTSKSLIGKSVQYTSSDNSRDIMLTKVDISPRVKARKKLLEDLAIYEDLERIKSKYKILKTINRKPKKRLHPVDLFCCNKKRWEDKTRDKEKSDRERMATLTTKKRKQMITMMKGEATSLITVSKESKEVLFDIIKNGQHFDMCPSRLPSKNKLKLYSSYNSKD